MKRKLALIMMLFCSGCAHVLLTVVNATDKPIKNVQIKMNKEVTVVSEMAAGEKHQQSLKVVAPIDINIDYEDLEGHQFYTSSPQSLKPGDGGSLSLSVTAVGTLEAVRIP